MADCQHEPIPIAPPPLVSYSALPHAGQQTITHCRHCGVPLRLPRNTTRQWTIWGWREAHGYDPYKPSPVDPPRYD